jgi:carboxymethylenebutenolidase
MLKADIRIPSAEGPDFDCYLVTPQGEQPTSAIVLASAIHGVDDDLRAIADEFASRGYLAVAPDLFWRTVPGPLGRGDARSAQRGQPRLENIRTGEQDLTDVLQMLRKQPSFNGRAALMGFCYAGPYAVLAPKRLGYAAGIACHASQMQSYVDELDGVDRPVYVLWGDQDHAAPRPLLESCLARAARMNNVAVHVFRGVQHGYMMRSNPKAFDQKAYDFSMDCALGLLERLR